MVDYVEEDRRFHRLLTLAETTRLPTVSLALVEAARALAAALPVEPQVLADLTALRRDLKTRGVIASDRRWRQALGFMRAWAWLHDRPTVSEAELPALRHVLWSDPDEREEVAAALDALLGEETARMQTLLFEAREFAETPAAADEDERARATVEARVKIEQIRGEGEALITAARRRGRRTELLGEMLAEIDGLRETVRRALGSALQ